MKVAEYLLDRLANAGIDTVFLTYGAAIADLVEAFPKQDRVKYVCMCHEQANSFAAEGYSKVKGLGCAMSTSGPGGLNMVTGIANCFYDSCPVVFITGQVQTRFMRANDSLRQVGFQETDIVSIVKPITKYAVCLKRPDRVRLEVEHALWIAKDGRPGPVLLDIPADIQKADV